MLAAFAKLLENAIASPTQLSIHYQPILDLHCPEIFNNPKAALTGFEALARWHHPELGEIPPSRFIPIAEETGLIDALFDRIFSEAAQQAYTWQQLRPGLTIAVNVACCQLQHSFPSVVEQMVKAIGIPPERVLLELTESGSHCGLSIDVVLQELNRRSLTIAIDDVSAGNNNLIRLSRLTEVISVIKLDRLLIPTPEMPKNIYLCKALVQMTHDLGMRCIAEGIETREQAEAMQAIGCDGGQGYYWSRALRSDVAEREWLISND